MNKQMLIGRLTKDPELRHTTAGNAVATFTVAVDRRYSGEEKGTDFLPCVAWKKAAETIAQYAKKGSQIFVEGRGQFRKYTNRDGREVKVYEVIVDTFEFLGGKPAGKPSEEEKDWEQYTDDDGELPF